MKKKLITMCVILTLLVAGCGVSEKNDDKSTKINNEPTNIEKNTNAQVETKADKEVNEEFSYSNLSNLEFWFGSGAGAWSTVMRIHEDGTFEGEYHDSEMGDTGDDYPNGSMYQCIFTGKFSKLTKVNDYTYSTKIENIEYAHKSGTNEIKDGIKYMYSEPYGIDKAEDILIYLKGAPLKELPEEYRTWVGYNDLSETDETKLPFYGLYNKTPQYGFSSYDITDDNNDVTTDDTSDSNRSIDEELASVKKKAKIYENRLQMDLTQTEYNETSGELYKLWDDELNTIWGYLKKSLNKNQMDKLTIKERKWISYKESEIKKAGAEFEGGSIQAMIMNKKGAELTMERVYELAKLLK